MNLELICMNLCIVMRMITMILGMDVLMILKGITMEMINVEIKGKKMLQNVKMVNIVMLFPIKTLV